MSNDKFVLGVGPAEKVQEALRRNVLKLRGHEMEILEWLAEGENIVRVGEVAHGISDILPMELKFIINLDSTPFTPNGWTVVEHKKGGRFKFDPAKISLHLDEDQKNSKHIEGNELRNKLKNLNCANVNLLYFYLAHPDLIPEDWKEKHVFFWGTIYRHVGGGPCVRCLYWDGGRWSWGYDWLDRAWCGHPAAVLGPK